MIVTYDLHTSSFGEISVPTGFDFHNAKVGELGGQLCCSISESKFCVWTMKEYGANECWTMLLSIDKSRLSRARFGRLIEPIALNECRDGRKLLLFACHYYGTLCWYDVEDDSMSLCGNSSKGIFG